MCLFSKIGKLVVSNIALCNTSIYLPHYTPKCPLHGSTPFSPTLATPICNSCSATFFLIWRHPYVTPDHWLRLTTTRFSNVEGMRLLILMWQMFVSNPFGTPQGRYRGASRVWTPHCIHTKFKGVRTLFVQKHFIIFFFFQRETTTTLVALIHHKTK